jgi:hypothetical protein
MDSLGLALPAFSYSLLELAFGCCHVLRLLCILVRVAALMKAEKTNTEYCMVRQKKCVGSF